MLGRRLPLLSLQLLLPLLLRAVVAAVSVLAEDSVLLLGFFALGLLSLAAAAVTIESPSHFLATFRALFSTVERAASLPHAGLLEFVQVSLANGEDDTRGLVVLRDIDDDLALVVLEALLDDLLDHSELLFLGPLLPLLILRRCRLNRLRLLSRLCSFKRLTSHAVIELLIGLHS